MDNRDLCMKLAGANTEDEVIEILSEYGYWDDPNVWRYYGDIKNNFSTIGNQQSNPASALVEKIINSVDAVLMRECLIRDINPEGGNTPSSIKEALIEFFKIPSGRLSNLTQRMRRELAENILVVATGTLKSPSYSIIDKGEGQSPNRLPETFLSLQTKSNKLKIPFVQGKFNMGGTGALQFCGYHNLQLIISKRDPRISFYKDDDSHDYWGFTIVRRENPTKGEKSSTFKYLAPQGNILRFISNGLPLLPGDYPNANIKPLYSGSYLKLYEYAIGPSLRGPVKFDLWKRISILIPNIALPIGLYERRKGYKNPRATYQITMAGLNVRLEEDQRGNLEEGFPCSSTLTISGQEMSLQIFAFKKVDGVSKRLSYSKNDGILFTINGQAHGFISDRFFDRRAVGMSFLRDSLLVIADCSRFEGRLIEDLFMNSRDRLREGKLSRMIEKELEELLKSHPGLRELKERRIREETRKKIGEDKPLQETIQKILSKSPTLSKLFIDGVSLSNPLNLSGFSDKLHFKGKEYPTFFRIEKEFPKLKPKQCHLNRKFRVKFETDAENEFFTREKNAGEFIIWVNGKNIENYSLNLWNGIATLNVQLPESSDVGDDLFYESEVDTITQHEPFYNDFHIKVLETDEQKSHGKGSDRRNPPSNSKGRDRSKPSKLSLPHIEEIKQNDWVKYGFDKENSLMIKYASDEIGYVFYVNMDNIHLLTEIKGKPRDNPQLLESKYKYGMVLIGLAMLKEYEYQKKSLNGLDDNDSLDETNVYDNIRKTTKAISPFLLPMINSLGGLEVK